jgi:hypothetical protein
MLVGKYQEKLFMLELTTGGYYGTKCVIIPASCICIFVSLYDTMAVFRVHGVE